MDAYLQPRSSLDINFKDFIAQFRMPRGHAPAHHKRCRRLFELLKVQVSPEHHRSIAMLLTPLGTRSDLLDLEADDAEPNNGDEIDGDRID